MADDDHTCPGLVQACEALSKALTEQDRLRAALAAALADRDTHVRGYEDMEQRHAAVVAERDQALREQDQVRAEAEKDHKWHQEKLVLARTERDALRAEVEHLKKEVGVWQDCAARVEPENDRLKAEVERLRGERDQARATVEAMELQITTEHDALKAVAEVNALRAAIAPTDENVRAYYRAQGQHGEARGQDVRDILAAIAARVEVAGGG